MQNTGDEFLHSRYVYKVRLFRCQVLDICKVNMHGVRGIIGKRDFSCSSKPANQWKKPYNMHLAEMDYRYV